MTQGSALEAVPAAGSRRFAGPPSGATRWRGVIASSLASSDPSSSTCPWTFAPSPGILKVAKTPIPAHVSAPHCREDQVGLVSLSDVRELSKLGSVAQPAFVPGSTRVAGGERAERIEVRRSGWFRPGGSRRSFASSRAFDARALSASGRTSRSSRRACRPRSFHQPA
jgi:hypothetical protein